MIVRSGVVDLTDLDAFLSTLDDVAADHGVTVQAFDARYVVDRRHLERAVELADRAFDRGENVARERGVEILLYAAGRRQIDDALEMGVSEGRTPVAVVVTGDGDDGDATAADGAADADTDGDAESPPAESAAAAALGARFGLDPAATLDATDPERVRAFFDVTEAELDAVDGDLADLVAERVALLDVEK